MGRKRARAAWCASMLLAGAAWATPEARAQGERCVAGELALPPPGIWTSRAEGLWTTTPLEDLPAGQSGCMALRVTGPDSISGVIVMRAIPRAALAGSATPHVRLLEDVVARLKGMNVAITEPKWRKTDVPFAGLPGFGNGTMFGFDGTALEGGERSDVIVLVFDGPSQHYDLSLVGASEASAQADWRQAVGGFRALLAGLNVVKR